MTLPWPHQHFHGLPDLFPGGETVDVVHLVQVDVVGLQAFERTFHGLADVQGGEAVVIGPVAHAAVDLGGQDDLLAASAALGEPAPDDLFGDAFADLPAVDVGGVEEVDAEFEGLVHDGEGLFFGGLRAEVHGAEAEAGDLAAGAT